ncbi:MULTISPECIES: DUF4252 domain-containing protein [Prevotella]|uniref:DUF4252 domain-containing protein n=1 Tax=Prevotella herbatica TaxID=2801997 RepID=A0ABM7NXM4_9BACT|nr:MULTISPECIES: DUF4252 domain-containing protein [Prevotella]MDN5553598.1 DUF4252 domain-containing protein [Prevotella sp.]BCS85280.1 DUF4252 domain-containing protein [Prevotella herbatica]
MKKIFLSLVLALATTVCTAQSVNDVIREFKSAKGATCINLNKSMIKLMGQGKDKVNLPENINLGDLGDIGKDIDSLKILVLEDCNASIKKKFAKKNINWEKYGYEPVVVTNEDKENVQIYAKKNGDNFKEIVVRVASGEDEGVLVQVFGNIDPKMLSNMK